MPLSDRWKDNGLLWVGGLLDNLGVAHMESVTGISRPSIYKMARGDREIKLSTVVDTLEGFYTSDTIWLILEGEYTPADPNQTELQL